MDELIERLKQIGLNTYEAKVYLALLKNHPATGYEISKNANVPQARAYDTLKALESQSLVVAAGGKPVTYVPIAPEEVLKRFESQYQGSIDYLRDALPSFALETVEPVTNLRGTKHVVEHAIRMIDQAQETLFMELWREDEVFLAEPLRRAAARGVKIYVVGYHEVTLDFCTAVYQHDREEEIEVTIMGERWLLIAADTAEGLVGITRLKEGETHALYTRNSIIVLVIKELVVHDIFLLDMEMTLEKPMQAAYGDHPLKLRRKILGDQMLIGAH